MNTSLLIHVNRCDGTVERWSFCPSDCNLMEYINSMVGILTKSNADRICGKFKSATRFISKQNELAVYLTEAKPLGMLSKEQEAE